jgi:A/G-specific adenine glycosylase
MKEEPRKTFSRRLLIWWKKNQRDFPWRHTKNPYSVLIAEMLLRKTTAQQVEGIYEKLISRYPNPKRLSEANTDELVGLIKPLGMEHKRARLLIEMGKMVTERYKGVVPSNPEELLQLPGVGLYATNAVLSFSHAQNVAMVDTNFVRLLERAFGFRSSRARARDDKHIWQFAETLVPKRKGKEFNLAVIDFAASVCGARIPKCEACPMTSICVFFQSASMV